MLATVHPIRASDHASRVRQNELAAMRMLSATLEELGDDQARERVIRWAIETFNIKVTGPLAASAAASVATSMPAVLDDRALTVDGLDDLFDLAPPHNPNGGRVEEPDMTLEISEADLRDDYEEPPPAGALVTPDQGVASMLRGFVADFQRLAHDWNDGTETDLRRIE